MTALSICSVSCSLLDGTDDNDKDTRVASEFLKDRDNSNLDFFVISDWGDNGSPGQMKVKYEMERIAGIMDIDFIISCGDNFHNTGVGSMEDPLWQSNYVNVYNDSSLLVPWYAALGNHDYMGDPDAQVDYSGISDYWNMPARYYSFSQKIDQYNTVRFIVLDTYGLLSEYKILPDTSKYHFIPQYAWLEGLLSESDEKWIFIVGHHPVFSAGPFHDDDVALMKKLLKPVLDMYKIDFYFSGHDHVFEHAKETGMPTNYIVSGAGAYPGPAGAESTTLFSRSALGFTYVSLSGNKAELYFITSDDKIIYSYVKTK
jgi:hypothetical protein